MMQHLTICVKACCEYVDIGAKRMRIYLFTMPKSIFFSIHI